ncbi:MAG TPA: Fe(2+)-trafficking protein [Phycisphaerae bacterium]|nr:Fe(2+)-trafficking protein [Phycisphaerae bacterium]HNU47002.1 Fe(2+)-trafficking protein [Phycisphaerae bacterium]
MDSASRIEQFRKMTEADPNNELGHLSLGKAYLEAGQPGAAIAPLARAVELAPNLSRAYELLGTAYQRTGQRERAVDVLTQGVAVADRLGDRMPQKAMTARLRNLGAPVPASAAGAAAVEEVVPAAGEADPDSGFRCSRCGSPQGKLERPPFKGALGQRIAAQVCGTCWKAWVPMGTKVINELRLSLAVEADQRTYDQYMVDFLQLAE